VLEPERRDSGPAIAAAAVLARQRDPQAVVLTLAADHVILDTDLFRSTCRAGRAAALAGHIVTFGLKPSEPRTSYGYIRRGTPLAFDGVSVRIPTIVTTRSDASRPPVPIDRDQCDGAVRCIC
jgi:mannose-1-phosphate guanylyltransferase / mannose-6-phosphate isomerase